MKLALGLLVAAFAFQVHADDGVATAAVSPMVCSYAPTATTIENLPMNPDSLYLDVESPKTSFMLFSAVSGDMAATSQSMMQDAQARIAKAGVKTGTVYLFGRADAAALQALVQKSAIENGQILQADSANVDFSTVLPVNGQNVVKLADGISCAYGTYVAPPKATKVRRSKTSFEMSMQCYSDADCLPGEHCHAGQCG